MTKKRFRVHDFARFNYSEIREYIGEDYTDAPLRNDEVVSLLNFLNNQNNQLKQREERLLSEIDDFQELLKQNDDVCYKRVIKLIDDNIATIPNVVVSNPLHKTAIIEAYKEGYVRALNDLKGELIE